MRFMNKRRRCLIQPLNKALERKGSDRIGDCIKATMVVDVNVKSIGYILNIV